MEEEDWRRYSLSSSSNGFLYGNGNNDYSDDDVEVLVTYKVSSAAEAIQFGQALSETL